VIGDAVAYDNGVVDALGVSGAGRSEDILIFPVMDCLPLFLVGVRVPKIELATSKLPPVSITSADATRAISARRGGSGVSLSLSSDQSPLSDMIFLVDCTFHTKIQKRKVVVRGQEGMRGLTSSQLVPREREQCRRAQSQEIVGWIRD
jgi:hypothetical protein